MNTSLSRKLPGLLLTLSTAALVLAPGRAAAGDPPTPSGPHPRLFMSPASLKAYTANAGKAGTSAAKIVQRCQDTIDNPKDYTTRGGADGDNWPGSAVSCAFAYLAKESREYDQEPSDEDEPDQIAAAPHGAATEAGPADAEAPTAHDVAYHASAPSITPLLFAVGAGLILAGLVFSQWLVLIGAACTALIAIAWFVETGKRRAGKK